MTTLDNYLVVIVRNGSRGLRMMSETSTKMVYSQLKSNMYTYIQLLSWIIDFIISRVDRLLPVLHRYFKWADPSLVPFIFALLISQFKYKLKKSVDVLGIRIWTGVDISTKPDRNIYIFYKSHQGFFISSSPMNGSTSDPLAV